MMKDIIERLEAATEGGRELDAEIWLVTHHRQIGIVLPPENTPRYTTSLDAALSLVPEGDGWSITFDEIDGGYTALVYHGSDCWPVAHKSAAIGLCIVALRARGE